MNIYSICCVKTICIYILFLFLYDKDEIYDEILHGKYCIHKYKCKKKLRDTTI